MNINEMFSELAKYNSIKEEAAAAADSIRAEIIAYMNSAGVDALQGNEHKATYKEVKSSRVDSKKLSQIAPNVYRECIIASVTHRFTFK